jgi:hypothetical protein
MAWPRGRTTLWIARDDGSDETFVKKLLQFEAGTRPVANLGDQALIIDGGHVVETPTRRVAAGRVVLWLDGDVQFRLESDLPRDRMIDIARSVRPGG